MAQKGRDGSTLPEMRLPRASMAGCVPAVWDLSGNGITVDCKLTFYSFSQILLNEGRFSLTPQLTVPSNPSIPVSMYVPVIPPRKLTVSK